MRHLSRHLCRRQTRPSRLSSLVRPPQTSGTSGPNYREAVATYSPGLPQRLPWVAIANRSSTPTGLRRLLLPRLRDELGLTILLSSHLLHEVERVCSTVAIIDEGRLLYQGTISDLLAKEMVVRITADPLEAAYKLLAGDPLLSVRRNGAQSLYVKMANECIPRVNALLVTEGIRVMELAPQSPTLEDVFMGLTSNAA